MSNRMSERRMPSTAEREARKVFRDADAKVALSKHERAQRAFQANRERLKAERLAHEAASIRDAGRKPKTEGIRIRGQPA